MNKERRKVLDALETDAAKYHTELEVLVKAVNQAIVELNDKLAEIRENLISQLEEVRDEEQEYYDNMSEGIQSGEKGDLAQEAINNLEAAISFLEGLDDRDEIEEIDLDAEVVQPVNAAGV